MPNSSVVTALGVVFDTELVSAKNREGVCLTTCTSGGSKHFHRVLLATNNATPIKTSAGQVYYVSAENFSAAATPFRVKLYDQVAAPNPAADTPKCVFTVGADSTPFFSFPNGIEFLTGIAVAVVLGAADTNNTPIAVAADGIVGIGYQ
jgi:hypothetical protein